jgi:hypothetical protein
MPEPRGRTGEMEDWRKITEQTDLPLGDLACWTVPSPMIY